VDSTFLSIYGIGWLSTILWFFSGPDISKCTIGNLLVVMCLSVFWPLMILVHCSVKLFVMFQ